MCKDTARGKLLPKDFLEQRENQGLGNAICHSFSINFVAFQNNRYRMIEAVKKDIFRMLDEIQNENILAMIKDDIAYYKGEKDVVDDLTTEQLREHDEAIKEADNGEGRSWEEFKREMEG
jgi:hypothetical protein